MRYPRAAGDPCFRVIAFAMAKNRDARFASASQLSAALQAVLPLLKVPAVQPEATETRQQKAARVEQTVSAKGNTNLQESTERESQKVATCQPGRPFQAKTKIVAPVASDQSASRADARCRDFGRGRSRSVVAG